MTEPSTELRLYENIPIDEDYNNTLYFNSKSEQIAFFNNETHEAAYRSFTNLSYQRVNDNTLRVAGNPDGFVNFNYLAFKNASHTNKWYYGFIRNVKYINDNTAEIEYEIDVIQTYLFDAILEQCFVDREHSETDNAGDNLLPENVVLGDYVSYFERTSGHLDKYVVTVSSSYVVNAEDERIDVADGAVYGGIYAGDGKMHFSVLDVDSEGHRIIDQSGVESISDYIKALTLLGRDDKITSVYYQPRDFLVSAGTEYGREYDDITTFKRNASDPILNPYLPDGFTPKNNKLYTYPYNYLFVTNGNEGNDFHYEYFSDDTGTCPFYIIGDYSVTPSVMLMPKNYKGILRNTEEKMIITNFPTCSYPINAFIQYLANRGLQDAFNFMSSSLLLTNSMVNPTMYSGFDSAISVNRVGNSLAEAGKSAIDKGSTGGQAGTDLLMSAGLKDFRFYNRHIRVEYARIIDEYFSMFGYKTNRVKIPNRNVRLNYTYTKTIACNVRGKIPADAIRKIKTIYDSGITFWKNASNVGDYTVSNYPVPHTDIQYN